MIVLEVLSWIATTLACVANIPQVYRIVRNRDSANLSMLTNLTWLFIVAVMFLRALLIVHDLVFIISQGAQMVIMVALVIALLRFRRRP